ncbi:hypothetical protein Vafri_20114 [Volvox africanus]|uniref:Uncharacterized protein n=1 Tax=Volvox africanus TaxID=51714 RepID=A0A8J4BWB6_9CHLO|nr:hypothetical protein Vafri_20114 [Volvox africanus]
MPDISDVLTHSKGMRTTQQIQKFFRKYRLARKCKVLGLGCLSVIVGVGPSRHEVFIGSIFVGATAIVLQTVLQVHNCERRQSYTQLHTSLCVQEMAARNMMSQGDDGLDPMDHVSLAEDALVGKSGRQWVPPILDTGRVIESGVNTAPGGSSGQAHPALPVNMANVVIPGTSLLQDSVNGQGILNFDVVRSGAAGSGLDAAMVAASCSQHPGYGLPSAASELHDQVAALLLACESTLAAASLPVASVHTELRHLATLRRWRQALEAEEAQLQGQASRSPPKQFCTGSGEPQPGAMCVDVSTVERNAKINGTSM